MEAHLDRIEPAVHLERLDRADLVAVGHRGQGRARLDRLAVDQHDAGAAVGRVAAPVRARQADRLADVVHEQQARLDVVGDLLAVDRHRDVHVQASCVQRARGRAAQCPLGQDAGEMALVVDRPRPSAPGEQSSDAISPACANSSSDGALPRSSSSARVRWIVVSPTALSAMPASAIVPPSIQTAADAAAIAQSPARRSTFSCALPAPAHAEPHLGQDLAGADRGHVRADVEVLHGDDALALGAADDDLRLGGRADGREVLGGVGLAERPADRAAVAHDRVGDHVLGVAEERKVLGQQLGLEQIDVPRQRADPDLAALLADVGELRQTVDVDQVLGVGQPQLHHRQQAVAARDDARLGAEPLQRRDRALDARRTLVLECRRSLQHVLLLPSGAGSSPLNYRMPVRRPVRHSGFVGLTRRGPREGSRLRGAPMSSRCSYCTGASVPMTGERGSARRARMADLA